MKRAFNTSKKSTFVGVLILLESVSLAVICGNLIPARARTQVLGRIGALPSS